MSATQPFEGKTVAYDFDGVCHSYVSRWTGPVPTDGPEPGARESMEWFIERGARIVVMSTRAETDEGRHATIDWLDKHGFPPGIEVTNRKVPAVAYIDDRAVIHAPGRDDWAAVQEAALALALRS